MPYLIQRRVRTSQPQQAVGVKSAWIEKGLYTATYGDFGDVVNPPPRALPADTAITVGATGRLLSQAVAGSASTGINFPKLVLSARTELFIQECSSRRSYGRWIGYNSDCIRGEYTDTDFEWFIHGGAWGSSEIVFSGTSPVTLVGLPRVILVKWSKDLASGYGRAFIDGLEIARAGGSPLTSVSNRTFSSAQDYIGTNQNVSGVGLFIAFSTYLSDEDTFSLLYNPWQIFEDEEEYIWVPGAGGDVTVALTGQSYTLSQGTHDVGLSKSVTGQSYTHTQGTLSASVSTSATVVLTGQSYTLSQGSLTKGTSKALTGQSYTLSQGDLGVSTSATVALTGQSYTLSQGTFGVSAGSGSTVGLTNQTYTISQGTLGVSTSATVALTGQTYALSQGAPLPTLDLGLANQTISYTQGTLGVSVGATVALTGQIYTHTQGTLGVSVGNNVTVALTGQDLNYSQGTLAPGVALAIAGQTYSLSQGTLAVVVGNNATVALTGQSYSLTQGLVGVAATVGLTGQYISFAQGTLGVTTDTNYYVSLAGQSYALTQGVLGVTNDTNYIVPLTGQSYTYSQRAPSVLGATIPTSEMRLYLVPPEDRRYTVPTY